MTAQPQDPQNPADEAELDRLLDQLLARFLRRLEADDFEAWAALDAIFTRHAPTLAWPEVRDGLAEYYKSGKSGIFASPKERPEVEYEISAHELYLETLGYGDYLYSEGKLDEEGLRNWREKAEQEYNDSLAGDLLADIDLDEADDQVEGGEEADA